MVGVAAMGSRFIQSHTAQAATILFQDAFRRASTSKGWGKPWYNQRQGCHWGISKHKAFYDLPVPQTGAGSYAPNPVMALNHDVVNVDLRVRVKVSNPNARVGLMARVAGYGDAYAAYIGGGHARISRLGINREYELKRTRFAMRTTTSYWIRLKVFGGTTGATGSPVSLRMKVWRVGVKEPAGWRLAVDHNDATQKIVRPGSFGMLFMHDDVRFERARATISSFRATSTEAASKTPPRLTYAFAGRTTGSPPRTVVVAKTDTPATVEFHFGTSPRLRNFIAVAATEIHSKVGVAKAHIDSPPPGTTLYWRAEARSKSGARRRSPVNALRIPGPGDEVAFAFGSCTRFFPEAESFSKAAGLRPQFFAHLGDFGYPQSADGAALALRKDCFQDRWIRMLARHTMAKLHGVSAFLMFQDDHDYGRNNCWAKTVRPFTLKAFDELAGNPRHFDMRYGDAHCFFVDNRTHADDPAAPDGPSHSLLGSTQKTWLKSAMSASPADLLVIFATLPFWDPGAGKSTWKEAFANEGQELLDFFSTLQSPNRRVIICSGNAHAHLINRLPTTGQKGVYEFVSSGTDQDSPSGTPQPLPNDPAGIVDSQRAVKYFDAFGLVSLDAAGPGVARKVRIKCVDSSTGQNVWNPLVLDL